MDAGYAKNEQNSGLSNHRQRALGADFRDNQ
jgi:hypothetical protein